MDFSAGAVVYKMQDGQPQYLLVCSGDGEYWGFPKGHQEAGETVEQTILREVQEETGCTIGIVYGFRHDMHYVLPGGDEKMVALRVAQSVEEVPIKLPNNEIAEMRWCSYDESMRLMKFEDTKRALEDAHTFIVRQK